MSACPAPHRGSTRPARPGRVVALGGGTGLPAVLRGMKRCLEHTDNGAITAVVAMSDDGGSSGRLRRSMGLPPPGDVRNCLVALSKEEELLKGLFQHRYGGSSGLGGHSVGNLILAALAEKTGSFLKAVEVSSRVLRTAGRILPATLKNVQLEAILEDGSRLVGETRIASTGKCVNRILLRPGDAAPTPGVVEAILGADLVVLGPGSLFTSVVPNLLIDGIAAAVRRTSAVVVLVANLVSERGEAAGLDLPDHLRVIEKHARGPIVDAVLAHDGPVEKCIAARYAAEGAFPLRGPDADCPRVRVLHRRLVGVGPKLRHDPDATARGLFDAWRELAGARALAPCEGPQ